jgi:hypothetical protein
MATGILAEFSDTDNEPFTACIKGKHSKVLLKSNKNRAMQKLELNHSNVCGPMKEVSWEGQVHAPSHR